MTTPNTTGKERKECPMKGRMCQCSSSERCIHEEGQIDDVGTNGWKITSTPQSTNKWEEKLMDEFCVMFERAGRDGMSGDDWAKCLETYICQTHTTLLTELEKDAKKGIASLMVKHIDKSDQSKWGDEYKVLEEMATDKYNHGLSDALSQVLELIKKFNK